MPRWPFRAARILGGLAVLLLVVAIPLAFVVNSTTGGGNSDSAVATGWTVVEAVRDGSGLRVTVKVARNGDSAVGNNGWSVLLDDGNVVPGVVVEGPERFGSGEGSSTTVEFSLPASAHPVHLRYDPDGQFLFSQPLASNPQAGETFPRYRPLDSR